MNERLRKIREQLDLTQEEIGNVLGIGRSAVSKIEKGENALTEANIRAICREFNVNEEWLRNGAGEMFKASPTDVLDALAQEYNLTHGDYVLIEKFVNMKSDKRAAVIDYILQVAAALTGTKPEAPASVSEMSADELHAELDRRLNEEKEAGEKS